jgi:hypothetical protein
MLCRDGSTVPVRLTIDVLDTEPAGRIFRACFTAVDRSAVDPTG